MNNTHSPTIATFDPSNALVFNTIKKFAVAVFNLWEPIDDALDLAIALSGCCNIESYSAEGAIRAARKRDPKLFSNIISGDYFIVVEQSTKSLMRYVVLEDNYSNSYGSLKLSRDPFGEVLRTFRSDAYIQSGISHDIAMETNDQDLTSINELFEKDIFSSV